ncbi:MAG TPA: PAS domain S-box protein, partial [Candidatus Limnocylindria bacterium]|nr:PAS domain S-box protein [Candidatus Limnocylindria bacterium]
MALLDARFQFRRTTPGFGHAHATDRITPDEFPQLELVLGGHARSGRVTIGEEIFAVEAVTTKGGSPHVLLTSATADEPSVPIEAAADDPLLALRAALEASLAITWAKDLDGRYVYVNPRFLSELGTSEDRILGRTDKELDAGETVDGPRMVQSRDDRDEPRQLEYTVPAFEQRGELSV